MIVHLLAIIPVNHIKLAHFETTWFRAYSLYICTLCVCVRVFASTDFIGSTNDRMSAVVCVLLCRQILMYYTHKSESIKCCFAIATRSHSCSSGHNNLPEPLLLLLLLPSLWNELAFIKNMCFSLSLRFCHLIHNILYHKSSFSSLLWQGQRRCIFIFYVNIGALWAEWVCYLASFDWLIAMLACENENIPHLKRGVNVQIQIQIGRASDRVQKRDLRIFDRCLATATVTMASTTRQNMECTRQIGSLASSACIYADTFAVCCVCSSLFGEFIATSFEEPSLGLEAAGKSLSLAKHQMHAKE